MEYDPEYLAAITREQDRLIWEAIHREKVRLRKREGDYTPRKPRARAMPRTTYAAHKARHDVIVKAG